MRNTVLFIIALFITLSIVADSAFSQKKTIICGKIKSDQNFKIHVYEPLNTYSNVGYLDTLPPNIVLVNRKDSLYKSLIIDRPTFITIVFLNDNNYFINRSDILMLPGDSVNVHFDLAIDNPKWATYNGANAEGNRVFNDINYRPYIKYAPSTNILDELPANKHKFLKAIDDSLHKSVKVFSDLKNGGKISQGFFSAMELTFKTFYLQSIIDAFIGNSPQKKVITKIERDSILTLLIAKMPPIDQSVNGLLNSNLVLNSYQNYLTYKKLKLNSIDQIQQNDRKYTKNGHTYIINKLLVPMLYVNDEKLRENLWAINLLAFIQVYPGKFDASVIDQYCSIFPGNKWEGLIRKQFASHSGLTKIEYKLQSPIVFVDSARKVNTLDNLLTQLPHDKPVFVDCWATWCAPCVSAFSFNKPLDSLLLANNISRLYISFDNPTAKSKWEDDIKKYCLGGYHALANDNLITDIKKICNIPQPEKSAIAIPRYLLIDKNGVVVVNDAIPLNDFELLKKQITESILTK